MNEPQPSPSVEPEPAWPSEPEGVEPASPRHAPSASPSTLPRHVEVCLGSGGLEVLLESDAAYSADPVVLNPGESFAGFRVRGRLGSGGMATVYRARHPQSESDVALKLLNRGLVREPRHLERFRREARLASRLRHPRIVTIHTYGEEDGCAYLTMQLVHGPTLEELVAEEGPLAPARAAEVVELVARAIDVAHSQRVVHRDLKPSNVMLHPSDGPLVLDFGLAKDLGGDPNLTETGEILGTPAFLAPEQAMPAGFEVDHRVDVYGLGAVLFYLLTGTQPHPGETALQVIRHILDHDPARLRSVDPTLPAELEVVCAKALARDPRDRYQTAADLARDLARFRAGAVVLARLPGPIQRLARAARKHPLTASLLLAVIVLLISGGLLTRSLAASLALRQRSEQGLGLLAEAKAHARAGRYAEADVEFQQAMLVTKGAFLEDPSDEDLRVALAAVKRSRAEYAESRGNWSLAEELRVNLARLEGRSAPPLASPAPANISVTGLEPGARVVFRTWSSERTQIVAEATSTTPHAELGAGEYVAVHRDAEGNALRAYVLVMDAGHRHQLRLADPSPPPPGVYRLPPRFALERALARGTSGG